ncbi:RNA-binding motif, single-stranded-interacting protein 3-like [Alosa sapidissima]|uniref:RNA-binding motif, single-stranded-interacting protein 3-like n=1 Tax=Alosa sapidissima TaxID=34773 RepID=UPI001C08D428|nr:RNA-binding motif, single-stranded-interacting protein 3-like [Alosa sapidissima]
MALTEHNPQLLAFCSSPSIRLSVSLCRRRVIKRLGGHGIVIGDARRASPSRGHFINPRSVLPKSPAAPCLTRETATARNSNGDWEQYGKIVSTKAILDKNTNQCKGYGFVDFDSPAAAQKAVSSLKATGVQAQMAKQQEQDPTNLYISNLPVSMDEQELENMLKPFGHVISTRILRDANGVSRGVGFARMESTEKCEVVIQHFNGKYLKTPPGIPASSFAMETVPAGALGETVHQSIESVDNFPQGTGMAITYDPAAMQNGFYSPPYSIATNRMIAQTSITPFIGASPVSTYQVQSTSWMPHQQYVMQPTGAVITPAMDHTMSMQPASMMGPLTQQMNHMSLGTTGSYMTAAAAAAPMQGTYIPQYTPVPPTAVPVEGVVTDGSPQTVAPSSQEVGGQQQQLQVETAGEHVPTYSYQSKPSDSNGTGRMYL